MSEDVLERVRVFVMSQEPWRAIEALRLIDALAAEVRALRKDRERLDWMQQMNSEVFWINAKLCEVTLGLTVGSGEADDLRSAIDAALDAAKGE